MTADEIFYDVSEFIARPRRTGIQRVVYEVLNNWQFNPTLRPAFIRQDTGDAVLLPDTLLPLMRRFFSGEPSSEAGAVEQITAVAQNAARPVRARDLNRFAGFLNLEAFSESSRIEFYRRLLASSADRMHWLIHDVLVWLRPELFPPGATTQMNPYLTLACEVPNLHFTSMATKRSFCERFAGGDRPTYHVSPLGADGFGRVAPTFSPSKRRFTYVGTVEPRKNHRIVLEAFRALWAQGVDIDLAFVGTLGWAIREPGWKPSDIGEELSALAARNPHFLWQRECDDREVRDIITSSRATLYVSETEGFGLPPLESLALGVPAIASACLPSLGIVAQLGQIRLERVSVDTIVRAVTTMMDDSTAAAKCREIPALELPTWKGLAASLHRAMSRS